MQLNQKTSTLVRYLVLTAILIALGIFAVQTIGLFKGGLTDTARWQVFVFYIIFPAAALVGILSLFVAEWVITKNESTYGGSLAFQDSDDGLHLLSHFKSLQSQWKLFFFSLIMFSFLGLYVVFTKQSFIGIASLPQQFTAVDNLVFSTFLVTVSENLAVAFWLALGLFGIRFYSRKYNLDKGIFYILAWIGTLVIYLLFGVLNHYSRYGSSDINIANVAMFWILMGVITMLTGSFIPGWVMHMCNNFFIDVGKLFSNEIIVIWVVALNIVLIFLYIVVKRKNKKENLVEV